MEKDNDSKEDSTTAPTTPATSSTASSEDGRGIFEDSDSYSDISQKTFVGKVWHYLKSIRMEPGFLIYMTASVMGNIIASDLQIDRACRINIGYNDTVCNGVMSSNQTIKRRYKSEEEDVQKVISEIGIWSEVVENLFPIVFSLFLGYKLPFLLAISGVTIRYAGLILCTYFNTWNAEIVALFSVLPGSLTGGRIAISMVVYSFVAVTSTLKERTVRMGILTAVRTFGRSSGSALGGYLKRSGKNYYFIFSLGGGLSLLSFLYILLIMPNPKKGNNPCGFKQDSKLEATKNIFNWKNVIESAKAFFKKREYGVREQLFLLVAILIFTMAPMQGEDSTLLLFVRNKLNWSTADYSEYGTFRMLIAFGGGLMSVGVLVTWLEVADWKLGCISCVSQVAGSLVYAFANNTLMMYIAPVVDILNGTMIIASRAMISKISPIAEMGKINSFIAVIDSTTPLWGNPLYQAVYRGTLDDFPGAFFILSAALTIPPLFLFSYFGWTKKGIPVHEQAARRNNKSTTEITDMKPI
ncbi:uncharacterized protein LOC110843883 isoform X2 [Folsomia candida]|uniref:uncharacterized protein LOC110843883 isoform X2 n=1 Tax=Folsomia candida TaxID=158441 RepID=UPI000B8FFF7F|nr:uncharacterized protein LOC110843883 isoform X2 [Folsomia candida]